MIKTFFHIGIFQATNFLFPLIAFFQLIRVCGEVHFGSVSLAYAILNILTVLSDYGFNASATRELALAKSNFLKSQAIFNVVIFGKLLLNLLIFSTFTVLIFIIPKLSSDWFLYLSGYLLVLGHSILPIWAFQVYQKTDKLLIINGLGKILFLACVLFFIRQKTDYQYFLLFLGLGNLLSSLIGFRYIQKKLGFRLTFPTLQNLCQELKNGWQILIFNLSNISCNNLNIIILGFFVDNQTLGFFSLAEKIMMVGKQINQVFIQAFYPKVCSLSIEGFRAVNQFYQKIWLPYSFLLAFYSILMYLLAIPLAYFLTQNTDYQLVMHISFLSLIPWLNSLHIPPYLSLFAFNLRNRFALVLAFSAILNLTGNLFLVNAVGITGIFIGMILTEMLIAGGLWGMWKLSNHQGKYALLIK